MPQIGQVPGPICTTSGCIGQVYSTSFCARLPAVDRLRRKILVRVGLKLGQTALAAEIIGLAPVLEAPGRLGGSNLHAANRVLNFRAGRFRSGMTAGWIWNGLLALTRGPPIIDVRTTALVPALTSYVFECTINAGIVYPLRGGLRGDCQGANPVGKDAESVGKLVAGCCRGSGAFFPGRGAHPRAGPLQSSPNQGRKAQSERHLAGHE